MKSRRLERWVRWLQAQGPEGLAEVNQDFREYKRKTTEHNDSISRMMTGMESTYIDIIGAVKGSAKSAPEGKRPREIMREIRAGQELVRYVLQDTVQMACPEPLRQSRVLYREALTCVWEYLHCLECFLRGDAAQEQAGREWVVAYTKKLGQSEYASKVAVAAFRDLLEGRD